MQQIVRRYRRKLSGAVTEANDCTRTSNMADSTRVLIVDSDAAASVSLESMLHAAGYSQTRIADSGNAACAIAPVFSPSVAFLEIELRDMTGYDVARQLRGQSFRQSMRLIALTFNPEHTGRELARSAGFECYLLKPIVSSSLQKILRA